MHLLAVLKPQSVHRDRCPDRIMRTLLRLVSFSVMKRCRQLLPSINKELREAAAPSEGPPRAYRIG
jgi:hypothetical protein